MPLQESDTLFYFRTLLSILCFDHFSKEGQRFIGPPIFRHYGVP